MHSGSESYSEGDAVCEVCNCPLQRTNREFIAIASVLNDVSVPIQIR